MIDNCIPVMQFFCAIWPHFLSNRRIYSLLSGLSILVTFSVIDLVGEFNGKSYWIQDEQAEVFYKRWGGLAVASLVQVVLGDVFWGADLLSLPRFKHCVIEKLNLIIHNGMKEAIESLSSKKVKAA